MKTIFLIYFSFLCVTLLAQEIDKPYDFPVKPGTEEWASLTSSKQMDEVCVIPDQILNKISTNALFITCLNYPRLIDIFLASNLQSGFDFASKHFNGLAELVTRSDLSEVLLRSYIDLDIRQAQIKGYNSSLKSFQIAFLEIMIAQENIINQFSKNEKEMLLSEASKKLEQRKSMDASLYRQKTTALVISRVLGSSGNNLSEIDKYGNDIFEIFNSHAILSDSTVIDKLFEASKEINIR